MKKNLLKFVFIFSLLFCFLVLSPMVALADHANCDDGFVEVIEIDGEHYCDPIPGVSNIWILIFQIQNILNSIIPVLVALGVVYFIWGVITYVINDNEEAKKSGKIRMVYGIIGLAVIVSLWGLVYVIVDTFDLNPTTPSLSLSTSTCSLAGNPKFQDVLCYITGIINNAVIPLIFALAVALFVWGVAQFFILNADDETKRTKGKQFMIWGIIALAAMLSVWGLVGILGSTFNIDTSVLPRVIPPP